jgi:hypothetical protein
VRSRIPLAYAGFLIVALVGVVGFAAFSAGPGATPTTETVADTTGQTVVSARVAAAFFAYEVSPVPPEVLTPDTAPESPEIVESEPSAAESPTTVATTTTTRPTDTTPPALRVTSPDDGGTVTDPLVTFKGTTEPGARVFSGRYDADVDEDGDWRIQLVVTTGPNGALFTARDAAGNETTVRIVVHYEEPTTTTRAPSPTTTQPSATTTTAPPPPQWSTQWPADAAGNRDVETWRGLVEQYWPADRVDCALGIIYRESHGNPAAYNSSGSAAGLMQHLLKYWKGRAAAAGFVDSSGLYASPYNGEANIAAGAYLAGYYDGLGKNWWAPWFSLPNYGTCSAEG